MRMVAKQKTRRKKIKNRQESSEKYFPVSSRSVKGFACVELAYKVKYKGLPGQLYVILSSHYARHKNADRYN